MKMKKVKIYLDTNVVVGWFKRKLDEEKKGLKFIIPERLEKLLKSQHELIVSYLVKSEVSRYLKSEWQLTPEEISEKWSLFAEELKINILKLDKFEVDLVKIDTICSEVSLKREGTIADLIHLQIAKSFNLKFLTSEKKLKHKLSKVYSNIIQISELS